LKVFFYQSYIKHGGGAFVLHGACPVAPVRGACPVAPVRGTCRGGRLSYILAIGLQ